jgi:hypothetical protein
MKKLFFIFPCLFLLTGCPLDDSEKDKKISELENKVRLLELRPSVQRYQVVIAQQFPARFTYLVDTQEGKIWSPHQLNYIKDQPIAWMEEDIIDSSGEIGETFAQYLSYHESVPPKK